MLLKPKEVTVKDGDGIEHSFIISRFPAVQGLEINALYPASMVTSAIPRLGGDYKISETLMFKIFKYVAVKHGEGQLILSTPELVNNHTHDWECLIRVIWAIMEYNNSFFREGTISDFFAGFARQVTAKISEILTQSSAPSSQHEGPRSTNSGQSTT